MRKAMLRRRLSWLAVTGLALLAPTASRAGSVGADIATGGGQAPATGGAATQSLFTYSQLIAKGAGGPNVSVSDNFFNAANVSTGNAPSTANPLFPKVPGIFIFVGPATYSPLVGYGGVVAGSAPPTAKPTAATTPAGTVRETLESLSNGVLAQATYRLPTAANPGGLIRAATNFVPVPGSTARAAAAAFDPFTISSGSSFTNYQYDINATLQNDPHGMSGIVFFALDSRLTKPPTATGVNTFYAQGQPLQNTLWSLTILATGPLTSSLSNLDVNFMINPMARSLGFLDPSMTDKEISAEIKGDFTFMNGTATLTDQPIFPSNTLYSVSQEITYAVGVNVGASNVPEPSSFALLGIGLLAVIGFTSGARQPAPGPSDARR